MKLLRKQMLLCSILFLVFTLSACSAIGQTDENNLTDSATSAEKTVSVVRGTITPTVSTQTTIVPAVPFIIFSPENGIFNTAVELEEKITAGQIIGTVNGKELKSPVDGTITSIAPSNESVPSNYPVAIMHYTGFALNVEADNFLSTLPEYAELKAKFQVYDGVGPTDMIAVVSPAADENAFTGIVPQEGILQCLISQTVDVKSGQSATVVITATTRNDVLILPLSVIAGRQGTGLVTVITPNGERVETKVTLGVTDGAKGISEKTLIKIKDLKASVKLNNGDMLTTVTNANMELQRGRSYAIVGKSGSGKTSLISIIGLLNREYEGEYLYDGISISALKDRDLSILRANNIGFVFQNYSLIKHLRVWENIELPLLYAKKSFTAKQRHEIITGLLKSVGLESKENDYPINLSGGEQQRVAIARALAVSPEAILCDEPTGALDKKTGTQIMELLHSVVKENGIMLLLVTHDPDIADTCDTIFEMDGGRITCAKNDT